VGEDPRLALRAKNVRCASVQDATRGVMRGDKDTLPLASSKLWEPLAIRVKELR
jgi:hypothetical protein